MTKEDEEFMLDNFVTFFIAGETVVFCSVKELQTRLGEFNQNHNQT